MRNYLCPHEGSKWAQEANHGEVGAPPGEVEVWSYLALWYGRCWISCEVARTAKVTPWRLSEQRSRMPGRSIPAQVRRCGCKWRWKGFVSQRPGIGDHSSAISDLTWAGREGMVGGYSPYGQYCTFSLLATVSLRYLCIWRIKGEETGVLASGRRTGQVCAGRAP